MEIINVKIEDIKENPENPRQATEKQYNDLKKSIQDFGLVDPLILNKYTGRENILIGGHFRLKVLKELGYKEVSCVYVNLPPEKERELNVRLNLNLGEFDIDLLINYDKELLKDWGFNLNDLNLNIDKFDLPKDEHFEENRQKELIKCPKCGFEFTNKKAVKI